MPQDVKYKGANTKIPHLLEVYGKTEWSAGILGVFSAKNKLQTKQIQTKTMMKEGTQKIYFMCSKAEDGKWHAMPVSQIKTLPE